MQQHSLNDHNLYTKKNLLRLTKQVSIVNYF